MPPRPNPVPSYSPKAGPKPAAKPAPAMQQPKPKAPAPQPANRNQRPRRHCFSIGMRLGETDRKRRRKGREPIARGKPIRTPGLKSLLSHMTVRVGMIAFGLKSAIDGVFNALAANARAFVPAIEGSVPARRAFERTFQQEVIERTRATDAGRPMDAAMKARLAAVLNGRRPNTAAQARIAERYGRPDFLALVFRHIERKRDIHGKVRVDAAIREHSDTLAEWLEHPARNQFERMHKRYKGLVNDGGYDPEEAGEELIESVMSEARALERQRADKALAMKIALADDYDEGAGGGPRLRPTGNGGADGKEQDGPNAEPEMPAPKPRMK